MVILVTSMPSGGNHVSQKQQHNENWGNDQNFPISAEAALRTSHLGFVSISLILGQELNVLTVILLWGTFFYDGIDGCGCQPLVFTCNI